MKITSAFQGLKPQALIRINMVAYFILTNGVILQEELITAAHFEHITIAVLSYTLFLLFYTHVH